MTQDEIIRMAREAGLIQQRGNLDVVKHSITQIERFAALVAAHEKKFWMEQIEVECNEAVLAEREACAKVCEEFGEWRDTSGVDCAVAIRARGSDAS